MLRLVVDPAAHLGHPQLHAVVLEQRRHRRVLAAVKRPLVLPDHDRVPPPPRIRELGDQCGGLRAPRPRHRPGLPHIEELRHDDPVAAGQSLGLLPLPRPRRHRILPVLGRDPPVKHEPQPPRHQAAGRQAAGTAHSRSLRPSRQPAGRCCYGHRIPSWHGRTLSPFRIAQFMRPVLRSTGIRRLRQELHDRINPPNTPIG